MTRGLIIFAREPRAGTVKTRLARDLRSHRAATDLYAAMLADVLASAATLDDTRLLLFWALKSGAVPAFSPLPRLEMFEQQGRDLGERMANAFGRAFASGCETCCIIGSDSPDLPPGYIRQAFGLLERDEAEAVFGPAEDGGYYLLGLRRVPQRLFEEIAWSSPEVLRTSLERARLCGLRTALLPLWRDIDTTEDLDAFLERPARHTAPRTLALAQRLKGHASHDADAPQRVRILLAEDHATNRRVISMMLNKLGYEADAVANGLDAVKALEKTPYDLVLMDCQMPEMNGYDATAVIRDPDSGVLNHATPVIALTANAMAGEREKCIEAGMDDYLSKPVLVKDLEMVLDKWLEDR